MLCYYSTTWSGTEMQEHFHFLHQLTPSYTFLFFFLFLSGSYTWVNEASANFSLHLISHASTFSSKMPYIQGRFCNFPKEWLPVCTLSSFNSANSPSWWLFKKSKRNQTNKQTSSVLFFHSRQFCYPSMWWDDGTHTNENKFNIMEPKWKDTVTHQHTLYTMYYKCNQIIYFWMRESVFWYFFILAFRSVICKNNVI